MRFKGKKCKIFGENLIRVGGYEIFVLNSLFCILDYKFIFCKICLKIKIK